METYIVFISIVPPENLSRDQTIEYWKEQLFNPLKILIAELLVKGEIINIINELPFLGVVEIEASKNGISVLREKGYSVR